MVSEGGEWDAKLLFEFGNTRSIEAFALSDFIFDINRIYASVVQNSLNPIFDRLVSARGRPRYSRRSFRVPDPHSLIVSRIRFESPGIVEIATVSSLGVGAFWVLLQCAEKIGNWSLNRRKLRLEIEKLERDRPQEVGRQKLEPYFAIPPVIPATRELDANRLRPTDVTVVLRADRTRR